MSTVLENTILTASLQASNVNSPTLASISVDLANPLKFAPNTKQWLKLISCSISSNIPNIYRIVDANGVETFNNAKLKITRDGGTTWTQVQISNGVYSTSTLQAVINDVADNLGYWTDSASPGFLIRYHLATKLCYVNLNSDKLATPGQLGIDFSPSQLYLVLGFTGVKTFIVDGSHAADSYAEFDFAGNNLQVYVKNFGYISVVNGERSELMASVPISSAQSQNEIYYPITGESPLIPLQKTIENLSSYNIVIKGSRRDANGERPIYITEGNINIQLGLFWR